MNVKTKKMTFDDSIIFYVSAIDIFQSNFVFIFTNRTNLSQVIFLYDLYIEREKMIYIWLWWLIYTLSEQHLGFPEVVLFYFSLIKQLLLEKPFSITSTLRGKNDKQMSCADS